MLNTVELNKILNLLNLSISFKNGKYYMSDYTANITDLLNKNGNHFEYTVRRDENIFFISFNERELLIANNQHQMVFNNEGFTYQEREEPEYNKSLVHIHRTQLNFYNDEETSRLSIKANTNSNSFIFLKIAEEIRGTNTLKNDTIIQKTNDDRTIKSLTSRTYNKKGLLVSSTSEAKKTYDSLDDLITQEISEYDTPQVLITRLESLLPGITDVFLTMNPNLDKILEKGQELKKRTQ